MVVKHVIFRISLPKEKPGDDKRTLTKEIIQAHIACAETFFSTLGALRSPGFLKRLFKAREDHFSLEIVAHRGSILFYAAVPSKLSAFFEAQLHAQYPEAFIEEVFDYNIFQPSGVIRVALLALRRESFLPLKTYKKFDTDPLQALTNTLSKVGQGEGAAIQIMLRPTSQSWHRKGLNVAHALKKGKKFSYALRMAGRGILSRIFWFFWEEGTSSHADKIQEREQAPHLSPLEEEFMRSLEEKASKAGFETSIRIVVSSFKERAEQLLENITNAFAEFAVYEYGNSFQAIRPRNPYRAIRDFIHRSFSSSHSMILNTEELASLFHLPGNWIETPNIHWLSARTLPAPVDLPSTGLLLGMNVFHGISREVHILPDDRRRHVYIIGKSGVGKSWLLANMARQDIAAGHGVCVIDPHGDLIEDILGAIPESRVQDVIHFDPSDTERPMGLNMLEATSPSERDTAVQEMIAIFYKLFPPEMIGPMFEHNMRNVMLTLMSDMQNPGTIAEIPRMFTDPEFQKKWVLKLTDPVVRAFWEKEMAKTTDFHKSEMLGYLISKVGRFVENEMMRNIIGQTHSGFNVREVMDHKKILLVNLAKGKVGEVNSSLLGLIIVSKLQMAALSRADLPPEQRHDFYLYIDEFQNFITDSIATILAEARKYKLNLILAHQYLGQLEGGSGATDKAGSSKIKDAVLGTVGTMIGFKMGIEDAEIIAKEFSPTVTAYDLMNIEAYNAYTKLLVQNQATRPFNLRCMPLTQGNVRLASAIKDLSRLTYGRPKELVEKEIMERAQLGAVEKEWAGVEKSL